MRHSKDEVYEIVRQHERYLHVYVSMFLYRDGVKDQNNEDDYWQAAREAMVRYADDHGGRIDSIDPGHIDTECGRVILRAVSECARQTGFIVFPKNKARKMRKQMRAVPYDENAVPPPPDDWHEDLLHFDSFQAFWDTLESDDKVTLRLRSEGKKMDDIARALQYRSVSSASRRLQSIKRRYVDFLK